MEILLVALALIVAVWVGRRVLARLGGETPEGADGTVHDPASALERERQRAAAAADAARVAGPDQPNTI